MSQPRQILAGSTYLLTRRTVGRQFLLQPDPFIRQAFGYVLAAASQKFGIHVHCAVVLSDHYHAVLTDPGGRLPAFMAWFHRLTAVLVNMHRDRVEAVWNSHKPSAVRLETPDDVLDKMTYVYANVVAADLVEHAQEWPGLLTSPEDLLETVGESFERPVLFFDAAGRTPERVRLALSRPPGWEHLSDEELVAHLRRRLDARESDLRSGRRAQGRTCLGAERAAAVSWRETPFSPAPRGGLDPHVAARDPEVRKVALMRLQQFRRDYRVAFVRWQSGERDVVFPAGTYALRLQHAVRCHEPPPPTARPPDAGAPSEARPQG